eukprot:GFKZ01004885.1.p1 GENE.GFKZ01004885.1~~GFKZ01004885.1.p1  ORF type:complete len:238 (-),score=24.59 GFKZ01004885.1:458-1171(-)
MPSYELAQMQIGARVGANQLLGLRHVVAGSFAGLCGSLVKVPVDVVKKRLQAGIYPNIAVAVKSIAAEERTTMPFGKVRRFYTGWRSSIFYDIPYNAVQFTVLENVKRVVKEATGRETLGRLDNVVVGALTGMITSVITEPVSLINRRRHLRRWYLHIKWGISDMLAVVCVLCAQFYYYVTVGCDQDKDDDSKASEYAAGNDFVQRLVALYEDYHPRGRSSCPLERNNTAVSMGRCE